METYVVTEYSSLVIQEYSLTERDRDYLSRLSLSSKTPPFSWYELKNGLRFEFSSFIGVLELEAARIVIKPKFNNGFHDVVDMLLFSEDLPVALEHSTKAAYDENSLMETLVRLFVKEVEALLQKGVMKEYMMEEENLSVLRGRVDIRRHLKTNLFTPARIYCRYDELTTNIAENQVIRTALEMTRNFSLTKQTMRQVNRLLNEFTVLTDIYQGEDWPSFTYNRLNQHYLAAHKLAYYLWRQIYVHNLYEFRQESHFSFLIDMNDLFEKFIAKMLVRYLPDPIKVTEQRVFKKAIMKNGGSYHNIKPDIVIESPDADPIVLDTKYKPYGKYKVSNSDIYQLAFYAQFLTKSEKGFKAFIIYPKYSGEESSEEIIDLLPGTPHGGCLCVKPVSIERVLEAIKKKDFDYVRSQTLSLIT
ncbi:McrC family protein [Bacillus songklensis]|uniref:McrC family protein n=1 Tax=Bacillus songklensis TaxID=1069116 RepID=A0ABV8B5E1_9BACI